MRPLGNSVWFVTAFAIAASLRSSETEQANLAATINPGALEILPSSLVSEFLPVESNITLNGTTQTDAITFNISEIAINDLNGDGLGWKLTAVPQVLSHTVSGFNLPIGTVVGFQNFSDTVNTTKESPDEIIYTSGAGVANYTLDYRISYTVPVTADAGDYTGVVVFNIVAQ